MRRSKLAADGASHFQIDGARKAVQFGRPMRNPNELKLCGRRSGRGYLVLDRLHPFAGLFKTFLAVR